MSTRNDVCFVNAILDLEIGILGERPEGVNIIQRMYLEIAY
jgi:hypothetical protein